MSNEPNYYQILNVRPAATSAEIERAWDDAYNQVRRLVTHHDPKVANRANQGLQVLEQARVTLLDPQRRAAYDDQIGISQASELGIQDEGTAPFPSPTPPAQRSGRTSARPQASEPPCPQCGSTENPSEARFCVSCQGPLTQTCPSCSAELRWFYPNCPKCGTNIAAELHRRKEEAAQQERALLNQIYSHLENARQAIGMKRWRRAKESLAYFAGLGVQPSFQKDKQPKTIPICGRDRPQQWNEAYALDQSANTIRSQMTRSIVGWTSLIYGGIGAAGGGFLGLIGMASSFSYRPWYEALFYGLFSTLVMAAIGAGILAISGALGSFVYCYQWAGKNSTTEEYILGALAPVGLALVAGVTAGIGLFVIALIAALFALGSLGSGG